MADDSANKITKELLRTWSPCAEGYKRFCELFPDGATLTEAIEGLVMDGHDDWGWWLFTTCLNAGLFAEITSKGYRNSGNYNSGDYNSGNRNSGDFNSGDYNSGNRNSGDFNSGDYNSGNRNSGYGNSGNWNSGDGNSGNRNSGDGNSGNRNSGNRNSGYGNSGNRNSGDWNSGYGNSGNWNSGDWNSGYFNIDTPHTIRVFGRECRRDVWEAAYVPDFLNFISTQWVDSDKMTDEEKSAFPLHHITGGILRYKTYKEAFKESWDTADKEDRIKVKGLPNFDAEIFYQISGIDLREENSK